MIHDDEYKSVARGVPPMSRRLAMAHLMVRHDVSQFVRSSSPRHSTDIDVLLAIQRMAGLHYSNIGVTNTIRFGDHDGHNRAH